MFGIQQSKINADPFLILNTVYLSNVRYLYVIHIRGWAGVVNDNAGRVSLLHRELGVQGSHLITTKSCSTGRFHKNIFVRPCYDDNHLSSTSMKCQWS
jgi:hypothetical protein